MGSEKGDSWLARIKNKENSAGKGSSDKVLSILG
jgi:hypothetical protein